VSLICTKNEKDAEFLSKVHPWDAIPKILVIGKGTLKNKKKPQLFGTVGAKDPQLVGTPD